MKRIFFLIALVFAGTITFAQTNSIVGKWKFANLDTKEFKVDLENPASMKKTMIEQIEKEGGTVPDSTTLAAAIEMMVSMFMSMKMEFTADGKAIAFIPSPDGSDEMMMDTASYTIDYTTGILNTISEKNGKEVKEQIIIKFEADYMIMAKPEEQEIIKMRRVK